MITTPRPLTAAEVLVLCIGAAVVAVFAMRARGRALSVPTVLAVALLASVVASAPFTAWAVVKNARASRALSAFAADRFGPENDGIDTTVLDRVARRIPEHATWVIVFAPHSNASVNDVFHDWAEGDLLPRVQVRNVHEARWVITFGGSPRQLGLSLTAVEHIVSRRSSRLDAWVGETQ